MRGALHVLESYRLQGGKEIHALAGRLCASAVKPVLGPLDQIWDEWGVVSDQSDVVPARVGAVIDVAATVAARLDVRGLHRGQDEVVGLALRDEEGDVDRTGRGVSSRRVPSGPGAGLLLSTDLSKSNDETTETSVPGSDRQRLAISRSWMRAVGLT
jgi:hypothetical protein